MKSNPWFPPALLLMFCVVVVLAPRAGTLYAQDRQQLQPQPDRPAREPVLPRPRQLPAQEGVNVEAPANTRNVTSQQVSSNPITGPNADEVLHKVEIAGVNLPQDTRVLSPITARRELVALSLPNDARLRLRVGKTQINTFTIGGQLPVLHSVRDWYARFDAGQLDKRSMSVIHLAANGEERQRVNLFETVPVELTIDITTGTWRLVLAAEHMEID